MLIYCKYNRSRLPKFQIQTSILEDENGLKSVVKKPLSPMANFHIEKIYSNNKFYPKYYDFISTPEGSLDNNKVTFLYIDGTSFDDILFKSVKEKNKKDFFKTLDNYLRFVNQFKSNETTFISGFDNIDEIFTPIFEKYSKEYQINSLVNIDLTFENILLDTKNTYCIIDNEWIYNSCIPLDFVIYRACNHFYLKYSPLLDSFIKLEDILEHLKIDLKNLDFYNSLEKEFQNFVSGTNKIYGINHNYYKKHLSLDEYKTYIGKELSDYKAETEVLIDEYIKENDLVKKNYENNLNHEKNLVKSCKTQLGFKDEQIAQLEEELSGIKNSRFWKVARFLHKCKGPMKKHK